MKLYIQWYNDWSYTNILNKKKVERIYMSAGIYAEINLLCVCILFIFMYKLQTNPYQKRGQEIFIFNIISQIIFFVCDCLWALADGGTIPSNILFDYAINIIYFSVSGIAAFSWLLYCAKLQDSEIYLNRTILGLLMIPAIILTIMSVNSPLRRWIFYIDDFGKYHRGDFYIVQLIVVNGYILMASVLSWKNAYKQEDKLKKSFYNTLGNYAIFAIIAISLQLFLPGYPFAAIGVTVPLFLAFLKMDEFQAMTDQLTGLHNNTWLYVYYENCQKHYHEGTFSPSTRYYLLVVKVDEYQNIMKNNGKKAGESLILALSNTLSSLLLPYQRHSFVSHLRYSDNEFVVFLSTEKETLPGELSSKIRSELSQKDNITQHFDYSISTGYIEIDMNSSTISNQLSTAEAKLTNQ